jgi:lipoprotein signal peptidase
VRWRLHLALAGATACVACLVDVTSKWAATAASVETVRFNHRPSTQLLPFVVVALALLVTTSLAGSAPLDVAAGLLAGGAFGNIASAFVWPRGIPDFIPAYGVLLNGADVTTAVGIAGLLAVALVLARRELRLR